MATATQKPRLSAEDKARVKRALDLIYHAQMTIDEAARELCPVPGFGDQWSEAPEVYDQIKAYWSRVNRRRHELTADR